MAIPGLDNINFVPLLVDILRWVGIGLLIVVICGALYAFYYYLSFPFKLRVYPLFGSGKDGVFSFGKFKGNRAKKTKDETQWELMFPLFKRKKIQAFDSEYIYPGRHCYGFDLNGVLIPGRVNISIDEEKIRAEVNPVPNYIRNWQSLQYKKNAIEFADTGWWEQNKMLVYMVITVFICCALCAATIWLTFKFSAPRADQISNLANALENFGQIQGR